MTKEVAVKVKGTQFSDGVNEIETICNGEFYEVKDSAYVVYEEKVEGSDKPVINRIKIKNDQITVTKKGPYQVQMIFEKDNKTRTQYYTPFGSIMMDIETRLLNVEISSEEYRILIKYDLFANEQFVSECEIYIIISQKK